MGHSFELREMSNRPFVYLDSRSVSPLALSELWDNPSFLFRLCSDSTSLDFCVQDYLICMCLIAAPKFTSSCRLGLRDPRNVRVHGAFHVCTPTNLPLFPALATLYFPDKIRNVFYT